MCFVFIWEQTATCATYIIKCLFCITDMKSVYCAVRTGSLNKAVCASSLQGKCASEKWTAQTWVTLPRRWRQPRHTDRPTEGFTPNRTRTVRTMVCSFKQNNVWVSEFDCLKNTAGFCSYERYRHTDWLTDWLTDWQTLNGWLIDRFHEWMNEWTKEWMNEWMNECK